MFRVKSSLLILVPVVALCLCGMLAGNNIQPTIHSKPMASTLPAIAATKTTTVTITASSGGGNISMTTSPTTYDSASPMHFSSMLRRLAIVGVILTSVVVIYFIVRFCRSGSRRKTRKYGVVKTPGDLEMRPLESDDDDDDEDVTMFNRKN